MNKRKIIVLAGKTFFQAALGYVLAAGVTGLEWNIKSIVSMVLVPAISSGLSAVMNMDWPAIAEGANGGTPEALEDDHTTNTEQEDN